MTPELEAQAEALGAIGVVEGPVDAALLVARVSEFVKDVETAPASDANRRTNMPDRGTIKQVSFPELMHGLHRDRLDGVLLVEHGRKKKAIEFREGWPVCVKSNLISECLGNYLVRSGRCTREQVDESLARMKSGEGMQGEILVAMDVLDEEGVISALESHAHEKLYEVFSWRDGTFEVRSGVRIQRGTAIAIEGHPSNLTVQGVKRRTPIAWIDRFIEINTHSFLVPTEDGLDRGLQGVDLEPEELSWVESLDGSIALSDLATESESIRRTAFGLLSVEVFSIETSAAAPKGAAPSVSEPTEVRESIRTDEVADDELRAELARMANGMQGADHYDVLGVSAMAEDDEIREAHARLSERAHPERFHGASSSVRQLAAQVAERLDESYKAIATATDRALYANVLAKSSRETEVEDEGRRALRAETEFQQGEALMEKRDYESALVCFGKAMENFPSEGEYKAHYGWCLYLCHPDNEVMLAEALEHCRQGVKLAKDREKPYLLLGRLYKAMGKSVAAKKMFTRAVQIKPRCVEAMRELRIMNMRRDKDKGMLKRLFRR